MQARTATLSVLGLVLLAVSVLAGAVLLARPAAGPAAGPAAAAAGAAPEPGLPVGADPAASTDHEGRDRPSDPAATAAPGTTVAELQAQQQAVLTRSRAERSRREAERARARAEEQRAAAELAALPARQVPAGPPSDERTLTVAATIGGRLAPKSVVATHDGLFLAQNMMYLHTIGVYDRDRQLVATIEDTVNLTEFGLPGADADVRGAPVEAVVTPDARAAYVSNYRMTGPGFRGDGGDTCRPQDGVQDSTLYRVDLEALVIDQVIPVGAVPKFVAITPDGGTVLVSNWCSYDLSVVDTGAGVEVARITLDRYPRGIVVTPNGATAYVALMGTLDIAVVDLVELDRQLAGHGGDGPRPDPDALADATVTRLAGVGRSPRHLVLSPDGGTLYATLNGEGVVARIDLETGDIDRVSTGSAPRSMEIAADGRSLYVVNYGSHTVSKVRTSDLAVLQTIRVADRPIGIAYDRGTGEVWVASYSGELTVLEDR